jgi:hypothetical protein
LVVGPPCATCPRAARCAAERLACFAFAAFVHGEERWRILPRVDASRERYERVMR